MTVSEVTGVLRVGRIILLKYVDRFMHNNDNTTTIIIISSSSIRENASG